MTTHRRRGPPLLAGRRIRKEATAPGAAVTRTLRGFWRRGNGCLRQRSDQAKKARYSSNCGRIARIAQLRVNLVARLERAKISMPVDIGFGDVIVPPPKNSIPCAT